MRSVHRTGAARGCARSRGQKRRRAGPQGQRAPDGSTRRRGRSEEHRRAEASKEPCEGGAGSGLRVRSGTNRSSLVEEGASRQGSTRGNNQAFTGEDVWTAVAWRRRAPSEGTRRRSQRRQQGSSEAGARRRNCRSRRRRNRVDSRRMLPKWDQDQAHEMSTIVH
jgi:hypothetical protein